MSINPTYPGVYVREVAGGTRAIAGVSTSTALFVGEVAGGPIGVPRRLTNYSDFQRVYSEETSAGELAQQVKLFFMNGGTDCWVMRIANNPQRASVELFDEPGGTRVLRLSAKSKGKEGGSIRAEVSYPNRGTEKAFNLTLYKWSRNAAGREEISDVEEFRNLVMDPNSSSYAPSIITQDSALVDAEDPDAGARSRQDSISISGRPLAYNNGTFTALHEALAAIIDTDHHTFTVVLDGDAHDVTLDPAEIPGKSQTQLRDYIDQRLDAALAADFAPGVVTVTTPEGPADGGENTRLLQFNCPDHDLEIRSASSNDVARVLGLGEANGGLEVGAWAHLRPAPTGLTTTINYADPAKAIETLGEIDLTDFAQFRVESQLADETLVDAEIPFAPTGGVAWKGSDGTRWNGAMTLVRDIASAVNAHYAANRRSFNIEAKATGYRLQLRVARGSSNYIGDFEFEDAGSNALGTTPDELLNVRHYALGAAGGGAGAQDNGVNGDDGTLPLSSDYDDAYTVIRREVDLFNLMVLPARSDKNGEDLTDLYGPASTFCEEERAFFIADPPSSWNSPADASTGVDDLRIGMSTDHSAVYYPRLVIKVDGREHRVGPAGAMAGLMARTDAEEGVWKAAAGTEANVRGVVGLERSMSDRENGLINPRGVNALRILPNGIVSWGARTLDGDNDFASEWAYAAVRRLALYIEESLYRGLKWVVFKPNTESLWSDIRLNVGSFMQGLYDRGAFDDTRGAENAFMVRCDSSTTTPTDQRLGIVNIDVGFQPAFPIEFVSLRLQQMTVESQG